MKLQQRRSFLAKTVELASTAPLVGLVINNFLNRTSYYQVDSNNARVAELSHPILDELSRINTVIGNSLDNLYNNYKSSYHKSHIMMVPYTYTVGETTVTGLRPQTYYRWEEPSNVPNHGVIEGWKYFQSNLADKLNKLSNEATIDLGRLETISVNRQRTNMGAEGLTSLVIYSPQIAALLYYEEVIAKSKHDYDPRPASELVEQHDTPSQITRRSFFKVGAALTGALVSYPIVSHNRKKREEGKLVLEKEVEKIKGFREMSKIEAFSRYFGSTSAELINNFRGQLNISNQTLQSDIKEDNVKKAFQEFSGVVSDSISPLENIVGKDVPDEISNLIKSVFISDHLTNESSREHRAVYLGLGLSGIAAAGAIAATLIPLEIVNEHYANKFEK